MNRASCSTCSQTPQICLGCSEKRSRRPVSKTTEFTQSERGIQQLLVGRQHVGNIPHASRHQPGGGLRQDAAWLEPASMALLLTTPPSPSGRLAPRRCSCVRNGFLHNHGSHHKHKPCIEPVIVLGAKNNSVWKKVLSNKLRGKWCHHISCSQLGGDPVSCQHQYGRSGRKMAQAKVRYRQGQRQVSKPGLWSCQQLRALGQVSVESTARDAKWEQGFFVGGMGKEANQETRRPLFFLCLAHH